MSIAKVIEVIGHSDNSWEEAVSNAVTHVSASVRNVKHVYVKEMTCNVEDGKVAAYRVNCNITFVVD